jgi:hypothetical protein
MQARPPNPAFELRFVLPFDRGRWFALPCDGTGRADFARAVIGGPARRPAAAEAGAGD